MSSNQDYMVPLKGTYGVGGGVVRGDSNVALVSRISPSGNVKGCRSSGENEGMS